MSKTKKYALRFLEWFCPPSLYEGIEGDLMEQFEHDVHTRGEKRARLNLAWNVLQFFRLDIILRNRLSIQLINTIMISNYFKIATRNIFKRKLYSFINAFGLSVAIAFCTLIYLFVQDERSFDQFHANKDRLYRMHGIEYNGLKNKNSEGSLFSKQSSMQLALVPVLKAEVPEVIYATHFNTSRSLIRKGPNVFKDEVVYVDADFFKMFSFDLREGNPDKLFLNKDEIVLTPEMAKKYFGREDVMGETIMIGERLFTVTGIIASPPANSSLHFTVLLPIQSWGVYNQRNLGSWTNRGFPTFVQLQEKADVQSFKANLDKLTDKYMSEIQDKWRERDKVPAELKPYEIGFSKFTEIHMQKEISWHKVSDPQSAWILGSIAVFILLIACINYISLALTSSASRKTEVGVRKVAGAFRKQLIYQFGFESIILAFLSMIIGVGLVVLFLPVFNQFTGKQIEWGTIDLVPLSAICLAITLLVGLLAGWYPALYLSGVRPIQVLKVSCSSKVPLGFSKPLIVAQFALSFFLIISSVIMLRQMEFITTKDLGYDQHHLVVIPTQTRGGNTTNQIVERFRQVALSRPSVLSVTATDYPFAGDDGMMYGYQVDGENKATFGFTVDPFYIKTMGINVVEGRDFDNKILSDTAETIIVNEALVRDMKWKAPLDERLNVHVNDTSGLGARVIGVVKDFHFLSLEADIQPMFFSMDHNYGSLSNIIVKISPENIPATMEQLKKDFASVAPDKPFEYSFMDEKINLQYASYERWMKVMLLSTFFAISISCLGLFGLSGINALNRSKEVGIRKVMGASLSHVFVLLNKQFVLLSLLAFAIAAPFSWRIMNQWLSHFQFKITMDWELFFISLAAGVLVALLTVSYHAIKTALTNPAETLKHE